MTRLTSLLTLITFTWATLAQALPFSGQEQHSLHQTQHNTSYSITSIAQSGSKQTVDMTSTRTLPSDLVITGNQANLGIDRYDANATVLHRSSQRQSAPYPNTLAADEAYVKSVIPQENRLQPGETGSIRINNANIIAPHSHEETHTHSKSFGWSVNVMSLVIGAMTGGPMGALMMATSVSGSYTNERIHEKRIIHDDIYLGEEGAEDSKNKSSALTINTLTTSGGKFTKGSAALENHTHDYQESIHVIKKDDSPWTNVLAVGQAGLGIFNSIRSIKQNINDISRHDDAEDYKNRTLNDQKDAGVSARDAERAAEQDYAYYLQHGHEWRPDGNVTLQPTPNAGGIENPKEDGPTDDEPKNKGGRNQRGNNGKGNGNGKGKDLEGSREGNYKDDRKVNSRLNPNQKAVNKEKIKADLQEKESLRAHLKSTFYGDEQRDPLTIGGKTFEAEGQDSSIVLEALDQSRGRSRNRTFGPKTKSLSPVTKDNLAEVKKAEAHFEQVKDQTGLKGYLNRGLAADNLVGAQRIYDERVQLSQEIKQTAAAVEYAVDHPLHTAAYVAGGALIFASMMTAVESGGILLPLSAELGAAGSGLIELANKDFKVSTGKDVADVSAAIALGCVPGLNLKHVVPASLTVGGIVGGYGLATDQSHLVWSSALIAGLGVAPRAVGWWGASKSNSFVGEFLATEVSVLPSVRSYIDHSNDFVLNMERIASAKQTVPLYNVQNATKSATPSNVIPFSTQTKTFKVPANRNRPWIPETNAATGTYGRGFDRVSDILNAEAKVIQPFAISENFVINPNMISMGGKPFGGSSGNVHVGSAPSGGYAGHSASSSTAFATIAGPAEQSPKTLILSIKILYVKILQK